MVERAPTITAEQWEKIRPIFTRLYIVEDKTLEDLRRILKTEHGFEATEKQCKNQITKWELRKKLNTQTALHILREILQHKDGTGVVRLSGRKVGIDEILKYFRRKRDNPNITVQDLLKELPISPTPSNITYDEDEEIEDFSRLSSPLTDQSWENSQQDLSNRFPSTYGEMGSYFSPSPPLYDPFANNWTIPWWENPFSPPFSDASGNNWIMLPSKNSPGTAPANGGVFQGNEQDFQCMDIIPDQCQVSGDDDFAVFDMDDHGSNTQCSNADVPNAYFGIEGYDNSSSETRVNPLCPWSNYNRWDQALWNGAQLDNNQQSHDKWKLNQWIQHQYMFRTSSPVQVMTLLEQGIKAIESLVQNRIYPSQKDCKQWFDTSREIAGDLINAHGFLKSGEVLNAWENCQKILAVATKTVTSQDMTVLQLIAHLFSWTALPQLAQLVRVLLIYLARLKSATQQPILSLVARFLVTDIDASMAREAMSVIMYRMIQALDKVLGCKDSVMVMWMKVRLCRHYHAAGRINTATALLLEVHRKWLECRDHVSKSSRSLLLKMDRELGVTLYQFRHFDKSLHHLQNALDGFDVKVGGYGRYVYFLQRLAACHLELGHPEIALEEARRGLAGLKRMNTQDYPWAEKLNIFVDHLEQRLQTNEASNTCRPFDPSHVDEKGRDVSVFEKYFPGDSYDATIAGGTPCFDDGFIARYGEALSEDQDGSLSLLSDLEKLSINETGAQSSRSIVDMQECSAGADLCLPGHLRRKPFHDYQPDHVQDFPDLDHPNYQRSGTFDDGVGMSLQGAHGAFMDDDGVGMSLQGAYGAFMDNDEMGNEPGSEENNSPMSWDLFSVEESYGHF